MTRIQHAYSPVFPEFARIFDDLLNVNGNEHVYNTPRVNMRKTEDAYHLEIAAPGLSKERFDLELKDQVLTVSAKPQEDAENLGYERKEFDFNKFSRSFQLPKDADPDQVAAKYENGILFISISKREEVKPKKITIS